MNRFKLGLLISTGLLTIGLLVLAWVMKRPGGGGNATIPEPISYAKSSPDGKTILVALGQPTAEANLKDGETKRYAAETRLKYPAPGLYPTGDSTPQIDPASAALLGAAPLPAAAHWYRYTPDENSYFNSTGTAVIRLEGDWWKTKAYPAGKRLSPEAEKVLLAAPALSFLFADGRPAVMYKLEELIEKPEDLPHSPEHILWPAGAAMNLKTDQFHLFAQDSTKITFDANTGAILNRGKNGLGNPIAQWTLTITVGLTVLLAAAILFWAWRSRRTRMDITPANAGTG